MYRLKAIRNSEGLQQNLPICGNPQVLKIALELLAGYWREGTLRQIVAKGDLFALRCSPCISIRKELIGLKEKLTKSCLLPHDVPVILNVVGQLMFFD